MFKCFPIGEALLLLPFSALKSCNKAVRLLVRMVVRGTVFYHIVGTQHMIVHFALGFFGLRLG